MAEGELTSNMFLDEIEAFERKLASIPDTSNAVVFYGSSSLRLWTSMEDDLAPLQAINLGFGGSSFSLCIRYYKRLFSKINGAAHFVFYCGDNDLEHGLEPEQVAEKFQTLAEMTRADYPEVPISVITIKPSPIRTYLQPKIQLTNNLLRKAVSTFPKGSQINIFDSMLDEQAVARPELFVEDQLHMNKKGYKIWKGVVRKHFGI